MKSLFRYITELPIFEGGASGHMLHPFEVNDFTGRDIEELIRTMFSGKMEGMTEKLDGFNIQASMNRRGDVVFIRNKSELNSEKGGMTIDEFRTKWKDNPRALHNYITCGRIIETVFKKIGPDFFNPNEYTRVVANCECIVEGITNTIPYASDQVDFHNLWIYKYDGNQWVCDKVTKEDIGILEKACADIDKAKITPNVIIRYSAESKHLENTWLNKWNSFLKKYNCSPEMTLEDIKTSLFYSWVRKNHPWMLDDTSACNALCRRWIFGEKRDWKKIKTAYGDHDLDSLDSSKIAGDVTLPLQTFFYGLGADLVKLTQGFANQGQDETINILLDELRIATEKIKKEGSLEDNRFLQKWLDVLQEIGSIKDAGISSTEGIVFSFKGKMMKWTGCFVPLNRIIGHSKYNML